MLNVLKVKCCYGHLGGTLGNRLFERLVEKGWFRPDEDAKTFSVTELGLEELKKLGVNPYRKGN